MKTFARHLAWIGGGAVLLAFALLPIVRPAIVAQPFSDTKAVIYAVRALLCLLPLIGTAILLASWPGGRREKIFLIVFVLLAATFCEHVHHQFVDKGHYFGGAESNTSWQQRLQSAVLQLDQNQIPHSYRFLSHGTLATLEWLSGSFAFARGAFRVLFNALLFAAILRYARVYLRPPFAIAAVLASVMIYPVTIAWYAGQPVDPMSHVSFIACLYFFARRNDAAVAPTLVLGVLAKESVAALAVCRAFYGPNRLRSTSVAALYAGLAVATLIAVRYAVTQGTFAYAKISGVGTGHLWANLKGWDEWSLQYLFTLGILAPGTWLGWRLMDRPFQLTCLVLTVSLVLSSALFSWLNEVRNLMPALVMLTIVNLKYVESRLGFGSAPNSLFASARQPAVLPSTPPV